MSTTPMPTMRAWILSTWLGWLLGIPAIVGLAVVGESIGLGGAQGLVGLGMGAAVGWMQGRALRASLPNARAWWRITALGVALPFVVVDLARASGHPVPYSLHVAVALGGTIAGLWQARELRPVGVRAVVWTSVSTVGWILGAGATAAADALRTIDALHGIAGALAYLGLVATGGALLGATTGLALSPLGRRTR